MFLQVLFPVLKLINYILFTQKTVVVALGYAKEALLELSDATGVEYIEDTIGAPRDRNNDLTKCAVNTCLLAP